MESSESDAEVVTLSGDESDPNRDPEPSTNTTTLKTLHKRKSAPIFGWANKSKKSDNPTSANPTHAQPQQGQVQATDQGHASGRKSEAMLHFEFLESESKWKCNYCRYEA